MRRSSIILGLSLLAACGGITSVNGTESTATLSPTDQNQLCDDTYRYAQENLSPTDIAKIACGSQEANADAGTSCSEQFNACVAQEQSQIPPIPPTLPTAAECASFNQQVAACNTTVGEYTKCLQQELNAVKTLEGQMPFCSQAQEEVADLQALNQFSTDCIALLETCQITFVPMSGSMSSNQFDAGTD